MTTADEPDYQQRILTVLAEAKALAREDRALTRKPLGITAEVAEYEAARLLGLELRPARHAGYGAVRPYDGRRYQIKGRCKPGQRLGTIETGKGFDAMPMVLLDEVFEATAIYEADRHAVVAALEKTGSRARNEREALAVNNFKRIGRVVWQRAD